VKGARPAAAPVKDPVPALTVQDEMHLLKEELGAFSGHYEGLIAELQRGGPSGLPTKVLAASATIEQFEDQLRQIYGRIPRAFPAAGYERDRSFYTRTTPHDPERPPGSCRTTAARPTSPRSSRPSCSARSPCSRTRPTP
jgi:hypothetical protein